MVFTPFLFPFLAPYNSLFDVNSLIKTGHYLGSAIATHSSCLIQFFSGALCVTCAFKTCLSTCTHTKAHTHTQTNTLTHSHITAGMAPMTYGYSLPSPLPTNVWAVAGPEVTQTPCIQNQAPQRARASQTGPPPPLQPTVVSPRPLQAHTLLHPPAAKLGLVGGLRAVPSTSYYRCGSRTCCFRMW